MEIFDFIIKLLDIITWPFIIFVILFLFKDSLRGLIDRIKKINYKDATILTRMVNQKDKNENPGIDEEIKNTNNEKIHELKTFYSEKTVKKFEDNLQEEMGISKKKNLNRVSRYLYNYSIIKNITAYFKNIYNKIYGSQIRLLNKLNNKKQPVGKVKEFYKKIKNIYPQIYSSYSFDKYLNYLKSEQLIKRNKENFQITDRGKDFINFMEKKDLPANKPL
jgi:hypothetical protein